MNSQLDEARRKGKLSQKDAYDIMVKLMAVRAATLSETSRPSGG